MLHFTPLFVIYKLISKMRLFYTLLFSLFAFSVSSSAQLTEQQQIQKLNLVYQQIRNNYVDDISLEPLVDEAIRATLAELDPHSKYLTKEDMEWLRGLVIGEQVGIGIRYMVHNDTLVIRSVMDNSPAQRAGIRPHDRIIAVDNKSIISLDADSLSTLIIGEPNSNVELKIVRRNTPKVIDIKLKREKVDISTVSAAYRIGDVGYIAISSFSKVVYNDLIKAYITLGDVSSLIIDLRNNGGGSEGGAIDLASLFLKKDEVVVYNEYRDREVCIRVKRGDSILSDIPLTILINEVSASASELFAGAIQDNDRGVIVGRTSFGKGLTQRIIDLKDGSGITLTIARYKTPSGRIIQRPYTMGDRDSYYSDNTRYMHPDSISRDNVPTFKTLKHGRAVYGGGGITPDVYINTDTIRISDCVAISASNATFEHAVIEYWGTINHEAILKEYPTIHEFNNSYNIDEQLLEIYFQMAGYGSEEVTELDQKYIHTMLLATIAEQLYGSNARHYIYGLRFDYTLQRAIEITSDLATYSAILEGKAK